MMTTERNGDSAFDFLMRKQHEEEKLWESLRIATMFGVFDVGRVRLCVGYVGKKSEVMWGRKVRLCGEEE
jgi:hypothetical protein